ncbi:hypothetical protein IMZ31_23745 (plasmid) [Pontibacillus sp. ALD_SL1]|uniref:hypothetical protein n=1 Tax=Pontibacillus sp. ALD_SL1 TaxID=2777185 RepID=UPI001A975C73|nr:hypothetical protein [Pontibacillus sp. ALD_SL1]QST02466.1 hypothetical protein IMZ31_23745 [Pontibacillus sp. ALD_SL1]
MKLFQVEGEFAGEIVMKGFVAGENKEEALKDLDPKGLDEVFVHEVTIKGYEIILKKVKS